jgi:hypothetical protein
MTETAEDLRRRLDEKLRQGIPRKPKPKPKAEVVAPPAEVVSLIPEARPRRWGRWQARPTKQSSYTLYEPSRVDEIVEAQRRNAEIARRERIRRNEYGFGDEVETIEDVVRRQDERWRR